MGEKMSKIDPRNWDAEREQRKRDKRRNKRKQEQENKRKKKLPETPLTDQLSAIIQSVNGSGDRSSINSLVNMMPAKDTRYLRRLYDRVIPNVDMSHNFECTECGYLTDLEVPFTTDFFWPKR